MHQVAVVVPTPASLAVQEVAASHGLLKSDTPPSATASLGGPTAVSEETPAAVDEAPAARGGAKSRGLQAMLRDFRPSSGPNRGYAPSGDRGMDSPPGVACGCLSVSSFMPNAGRLLRSFRRDGANSSEDRSLREFCEVMLGPEMLQAHAGQADDFGGNSCGLCLEELSPEIVRMAALRAAAEGGRKIDFSREVSTPASLQEGGSSGSRPLKRGLARGLQPYLEDLLIRRQGFKWAVDLLAAAADADERIPKVLTEITAKDLFLALVLVTPSRRRRVHLASAYAALRAPVPLVFRTASPEAGDLRRTATRLVVDAVPLLALLVCFALYLHLCCCTSVLRVSQRV